MKVDFLFLFEHLGLASEPFTRRGYSTCIVDILNKGDNPKATYTLDWNILERKDDLKEIAQNARFVFGMPPCTDLTNAGAKHWDTKFKQNPKFLDEAEELFMTPVEIAGDRPYAIENPVGLMSARWREPDFKFNPNEYGGYLPDDDVHPLWPQYIEPRDAYPKETCIWKGNYFLIPPTRTIPILPGWSKQTTKLGGKSLKTKIIRSASPRGWFEALAILYCDRRKG